MLPTCSFFIVSEWDNVKQKQIVPNKIGLVSSNIKEEKGALKDGRGPALGSGVVAILTLAREGRPVPPSQGSIGTSGRPGLE